MQCLLVQLVTCMAYTYHEHWAFTSSLPLPLVYAALQMTQPDLASHLQKALQLEDDSPLEDTNRISFSWQTSPQYTGSTHAEGVFGEIEAPLHRLSLGAKSVGPRDGDNAPIEFDALFCYKQQEILEDQLRRLDRDGCRPGPGYPETPGPACRWLCSPSWWHRRHLALRLWGLPHLQQDHRGPPTPRGRISSGGPCALVLRTCPWTHTFIPQPA